MGRFAGNSSALRTLLTVALLLACSLSASSNELRRQGFIGVRVVPIPDTMQAQLNLASGRGILVEQVIANGSAQEAGILANDIILRVNGTDISEVNQFTSLVRSFRSGDRFQIILLRNNRQVSVDVEVKPRPLETHPAFDILYQSVVADNAGRRVIITKPKAAGKYPAILFVTGVGCGSQDNLTPEDALAKVLYGLTQRGVVTMRVEKSGVGDSEGLPCSSPQADLQAEVRGYVAGLRALKSYTFVDSRNVFILGLSIGGIVGPMVANQVPVKGIIVAETVGISWYEYELANLRRQLILRGVAYHEVEGIVRQKERCNHRLYIERQTPEQIARDAPECARLPIQPPAPYTYMQQVANLNLADVWRPLDVPVLVIYGTSDFLTSGSEHEYLANIINSYHPGRTTFISIRNMDHYLARASSMQESMGRTGPGEFHPEFLVEVQRWLDAAIRRV